jgi:hypothetical protein
MSNALTHTPLLAHHVHLVFQSTLEEGGNGEINTFHGHEFVIKADGEVL